MNTAKWIASIIGSVAIEVAKSQADHEADVDGRQENESVSTLEFLTGLRAKRSGGSDTQHEPAF
jgi:hypothetical protein